MFQEMNIALIVGDAKIWFLLAKNIEVVHCTFED